MSKNRTMAQKNAKVVKYKITSGKTAMAMDAYNEYQSGLAKKTTSGIALYGAHSEFMANRPVKRQKWMAK